MMEAAIWHDVECGSYTADLELWEALSRERDAVLDLGCGTGRVALHLARCGRRVTGLDQDPQLLATLELRTQVEGLQVDTVCADAREFDLGVQFDAVFAPMQLAQLFHGAGERRAMLASVARHLRPGGVFATTLMDLEGELLDEEYGPPAADTREVDSWVYSSLSAAAHVVDRGRALRIQRLRTTLSPQGEESTSVDEVRLELVSPDELEAEAADSGLKVEERRAIPATDHVGCVVVVASRAEDGDMTNPAIWHDLECGSYTADLQLWEELAGEGASVLDLGAGTGRVAMHLARRGREVTAVEWEATLIGVLEERSAERELDVEVVCADVRDFRLDREFDVVLAPMQLVQLLRGADEQRAMLKRAVRHLRPSGLFAAALMDLDGEVVGDEYAPPTPDMREVEDWVYSSQPVAIRPVHGGKAIVLDRVRTAVAPDGEQQTSVSCVRLELVTPEALEGEMHAAGLAIQPRRVIPPTEDHVGSVVVVGTAAGAAA